MSFLLCWIFTLIWCSSFRAYIWFSFSFLFLFLFIFYDSGTRGYESQEKDRPQFRGDVAQPLKRSFVTNRKETFYPSRKRFWIKSYSMLIVFIFVIFTEAIFGFFFYVEYLVEKVYTDYDIRYYNWFVVLGISISIEVLSSIYLNLSEYLTNNENYKTETNYEDALITKTLIFKLFNHYSALIFTAFFKGPILDTCDINCIIDVKELLIGIFIIRFLKSLWQLFVPFVRSLTSNYSGGKSNSGFHENQPKSVFEKEDEYHVLQGGKKFSYFCFTLKWEILRFYTETSNRVLHMMKLDLHLTGIWF